jgi:hypothetical protein
LSAIPKTLEDTRFGQAPQNFFPDVDFEWLNIHLCDARRGLHKYWSLPFTGRTESSQSFRRFQNHVKRQFHQVVVEVREMHVAVDVPVTQDEGDFTLFQKLDNVEEFRSIADQVVHRDLFRAASIAFEADCELPFCRMGIMLKSGWPFEAFAASGWLS